MAEGTAARCLRTVYLGPGLAAVYAFGADVLENWKRFDPDIRLNEWLGHARILGALLSNHLPNYRNLMSSYFALQAAKKS